MIIFGDEPTPTTMPALAAGFLARLEASPTAPSLADLRIELVLAGQLEQAAEDAAHPAAPLCRELTRLAAERFVASWRGPGGGSGAGQPPPEAVAVLLRRIAAAPAQPTVELRTPEGFAWYALYPDAYAQAAAAWAAGAPRGRVLVIGIRSIGTTLAAAVTAVLRAGGLAANAVTVRPAGPPFARRTAVPASARGADWLVVVDEGPGLSGSSMASVAEAARALGIPAGRIVFFPGHAHGPGVHAPATARQWWAAVPVEVVTPEQMLLGGRPTIAHLAELAVCCLGEPLRGAPDDIGAGRWRRAAGIAPGEAPAVAPSFERAKFLARGRSGKAIVAKFAGLAAARPLSGLPLISLAERAADRLTGLAAEGWTVPPMRATDGWLALPWAEGRRLRASDADPEMVTHLAAYMRRAAGPPLEPAVAEASFERLSRMAVANARELLGEAAAATLLRAGERLRRAATDPDWPGYGDGRLAPHEWLRTPAGRLVKTDAEGHTQDHTAIGRQSLAWDIAGAAVEWRLAEHATAGLAEAAAGPICRAALLAYYRSAYAAFRAALARFCAGQSVGAEADRLEQAGACYVAALRDAIARLEQTSTRDRSRLPPPLPGGWDGARPGGAPGRG